MRNSAFSGLFYEALQKELLDQLKSCFLSDFGPGKLPKQAHTANNKANIKGIIVPHAGYSYSGPCAAHSYLAVAEAENPDLFIILGTSHDSCKSCLNDEDWKIPLGIAKIDKAFADALVHNGIPKDNHAHIKEHSIEVQLPFLQFIKKKFLFVPILVSENYQQVADSLLKTLQQTNKKAVIIASSDFTHYGKNYNFLPFDKNVKQNLYDLDKGAIKYIQNMDSVSFLKYIEKTSTTICGKYAIAALIRILNHSKVQLLKYYTSADITNQDYSMAVGYAALKFI